jgi:hypothetical protein
VANFRQTPDPNGIDIGDTQQFSVFADAVSHIADLVAVVLREIKARNVTINFVEHRESDNSAAISATSGVEYVSVTDAPFER